MAVVVKRNFARWYSGSSLTAVAREAMHLYPAGPVPPLHLAAAAADVAVVVGVVAAVGDVAAVRAAVVVGDVVAADFEAVADAAPTGSDLGQMASVTSHAASSGRVIAGMAFRD